MLAVTVTGCSSSENGGAIDDSDIVASKGRAQMNDVTVLYPLATSRADFDKGYLAATSAGNGGALIPKATYVKAFGADSAGGVGSDIHVTYDSLRIVAIRLDPCFAQIGPITKPASCQNQLRVVFQSLSFVGDTATAVDGAVHAFYSLTRDELTAAVKEIVALRIASKATEDLGPLAIHPIVAKEGLQGPMATGLNALVLEHAGAKNLVRFTRFVPSGLATQWGFSGFDISSGDVKPMDIPTLPKGTTAVSFFAGFGVPMTGVFNPPTTAKDNVLLLADGVKAKAASLANQKAAYDGALRIENPEVHSPNTIDCASCHTAQLARATIGEEVLKLSTAGNANVFAADSKFVSAQDMKVTTPPMRSNLHMLSYQFRDPMIGQRVINETASIVALLNREILPPSPK